MFFFLQFLVVLVNVVALLPFSLGGGGGQVFVVALIVTLASLWKAGEYAKQESWRILTARAALACGEPDGNPFPRARLLFTIALVPWMPVTLSLFQGYAYISACIFCAWVLIEAAVFLQIARLDEDASGFAYQKAY